MRIAVAGGTGAVGRQVVERLAGAGHDPVVLARSAGVDLVRGTDLDEALAGAEAVIDVCGIQTARRRAAEDFFERTTENLLAAERRAGVPRHVALSVVGCDRVDFGYYFGKRRQEELVSAAGGVVVRSTQFHEFVRLALGQVPGPVAVVPRMRLQPISSAEVAAALVAVALGSPAPAGDLAGPRPERLAALARRLLARERRRKPLLELPIPGRVGRAWAADGLLPVGPATYGAVTFDEWLGTAAGLDTAGQDAGITE